MWLHIDVDKVERCFTSFTDSRPSPRSRRRSRFLFPSSRTQITDLINMKAVTRRASLFLLALTAYFAVAIFLFVSALAATILYQYRHYIHHFHWRLLKLLYRIALDNFFGHDPPMQYVIIVLVFSALGFSWLLTLRWAWNRRAKRLNHEASLPQTALATDTSVWPPPPIAPVPAVALLKK